MYRRQFIKLVGAGLATGLTPTAALAKKTAGHVHASYLVPGYMPEYALKGGVALARHPEFTRGIGVDYRGPRTLVTRLDEADHKVTRAVFPVKGHHIAVSPNRRQAFFSTMDGEAMVLFDPHTLEFLAQTRPHATDYIGGGHAVYLPDGETLVVTERRRLAPWSGDPARHEGRISVRDARTLEVLEHFPCGGIHPHDIALMADGRHVAISNYGRTDWPGEAKAMPFVAEPSLSVVDLHTGKLRAQVRGADRRFEIRHLAGPDLQSLFVIQTAMLEDADAEAILRRSDEIMDVDLSTPQGLSYTPAPLLGIRISGGDATATEMLPADGLRFRQGQSIVYDPVHDEAIATFTSSHTIAIIEASKMRIRKLIRTDELGLQHPRGVVLHPDGEHYAVSGSWRDLYLFRRGSHTLNRARCWYQAFYDHSHMSIM